MINTKTTKRALLSSVVALLLCFAMLVGTTFAWFTDSVTSGGNIIKSGTLDVEMYWADGTVDPSAATWTDASTGAIFNYDKWEPGYVSVRHIKIENKGTLALKYKVMIVANGEVSDLADVIDVYYVDPAVQVADRAALTDANKIGTLTEVLANLNTTGSGKLAAAENHTVTLALKMQETAGNEYQNKSIGSSFSVVLVATQLSSENDSFGDDYDDGAEFPEVNITNAVLPENRTEDTLLNTDNAGVNIPADAPAGNYDLETTEMELTTDSEGNVTATLDITLKKDGEKVVANGTVVYTVSVEIGTGLNLTSVKHNGEVLTDYDYNSATGIITFETTHFSPFSFTYNNGEKAESAESLAELVAKGGVVQLNGNVDLTDAPLVITKDTVLNLNGYTLSGISTAATTSYLIQIKNGASLMIQNGTVTFVATNPDTEWGGEGQRPFPGYANNTIKAEGKLIVNNAKIENTTAAGGASYAIDCYPGADVVINDGSYIDGCGKNAIRMFANSDKTATNVTINGGTVTGTRAVWVQLPGSNSASKKLVNLTVNGGTLISTEETYNLAIYSYSYGDSFAGVNIALNGGVYNGNVAFGGGYYGDRENVTISTSCQFNGEYGVYRYTEDSSISYVFVDTADELAAAIQNGDIAILVKDIEVDADNTITVPAGVEAYLDLNGYKISATADKTGNQELFLVKGNLTVKNGSLELVAKNNQGWGAMATIFDITAGGVLNLDGVTTNTTGTDMSFAAHLNNWGTATLNVKNSTLKSSYIAVRAFNSGYDMNNITIEDSTLEGKYCFWVHNYTAEGKDDSTLNVNIYGNGNTFVNSGKAPVLYGFDNSIYYDANGNVVA
ncbi:MAG: SipW-dependent-type signal peptide-containing protein [Clostridia bacterium]|nr:SipW-dependent-type signal peptide-containing protein [Clostridia bacterium]